MDFSDFSKIMLRLLPKPWPKKMAVAVSGGSDSLCLLFWVQKFAQERGLSVVSLIVDHRLRPESTQEAYQTADGLSGEKYILSWPHPIKKHALMRKARYHLLCSACHRAKTNVLLFGHHQDDLLETVVLREDKGSHWRGLAGISCVEERHGIVLLRPLLTASKEALRKALAGHPYVEDPSNHDSTSIRTKVRLFLKDRQNKELLHRTQQYAERRQAETETFCPIGFLKPEGYYVVGKAEFFSIPKILGPWYLWHWIRSISYQMAPLSEECLRKTWETIAQQISFSQQPRTLGTLGGVIIMAYSDQIYLFREWGRLAVSKASFCGFWDGRFLSHDRWVAQGLLPGKPWAERRSLASHPMHADPLRRWTVIPCSSPMPQFISPFLLAQK